jgi:hypothetical protein
MGKKSMPQERGKNLTYMKAYQEENLVPQEGQQRTQKGRGYPK